MIDLKQWALSVAGEFEPEVKQAALDVAVAAAEYAAAPDEDRQVRHSLLLEALASAERRGNEAGKDIAGRLAALVLSAVTKAVVG
jgi:hypothetical protein